MRHFVVPNDLRKKITRKIERIQPTKNGYTAALNKQELQNRRIHATRDLIAYLAKGYKSDISPGHVTWILGVPQLLRRCREEHQNSLPWKM
jgi:hypothetical protein